MKQQCSQQQRNLENWFNISQYCLIETNNPLGNGASGVVYKGILQYEEQQPLYVAVKELKKQISQNQINEYFEQEVIICREIKEINCPHIMQIIDIIPYQIQDGSFMYYLVMELCNKDLAQFKKEKGGKLEPLLALKILKQIALGIQALHNLNIAHRDIKPANIFIKENQIDGSFICKVGDFGLGKQNDIFQSTIGTICYMAPEMLNFENVHYTRKVDVWALGVMAHELLTGVIIFHGERVDIIRNQILGYTSYKDQRIQSLNRANQQKDLITNSFKQIEAEPIVDMIDQMLQKNPEERKTIDQIILLLEQTITIYEKQRQSKDQNSEISITRDKSRQTNTQLDQQQEIINLNQQIRQQNDMVAFLKNALNEKTIIIKQEEEKIQKLEQEKITIQKDYEELKRKYDNISEQYKSQTANATKIQIEKQINNLKLESQSKIQKYLLDLNCNYNPQLFLHKQKQQY